MIFLKQLYFGLRPSSSCAFLIWTYKFSDLDVLHLVLVLVGNDLAMVHFELSVLDNVHMGALIALLVDYLISLEARGHKLVVQLLFLDLGFGPVIQEWQPLEEIKDVVCIFLLDPLQDFFVLCSTQDCEVAL